MKDNPQNDENAFSQLKERPCLCGCGQSFKPTRKWQKYLNDEHRKRAYEKAPRLDKTKLDKLRILLTEASEILETL
jgi:hypothetical protein